MFGIGGGVLLIPVIGMLYGLDQQVAQGTTLVMVVPNVLYALYRYRQRVGVDLRIAATLGLSALVATYPAARFATGLDPHDLRLAFAGFLVVLAAILAWRTWRGGVGAPQRPPLAWGWSAVLGLAGGVVSGLFGVGGAFIAPPVLTAFFGVRQVEAQGLALALVCPGTVVALLTYAGAGQVDWALGVPLAIGGIAAISARRRGGAPPAGAAPAPGLLRPAGRHRRAARAARVSESAYSPLLSRSAVQGSGSRPVRHIVAHLECALDRFDPGPAAPPRDERAGDGRSLEIRIATASLTTPRRPDGVIAQPSAPQLSSSQALMRSRPAAEPVRRHRHPDATGKRRSASPIINFELAAMRSPKSP